MSSEIRRRSVSPSRSSSRREFRRSRSRSKSPPRRPRNDERHREREPIPEPPPHRLMRPGEKLPDMPARAPRQQNRNRHDNSNDLSDQLSRLPESERFGRQNEPRRDNTNNNETKIDEKDKAKPNFALSGKLAAETNTVHGVVLKYSEPVESKKPMKRWRLHVFKEQQQLEPLRIYRQSAYLIGRERLVCDIPVDHPSCSKQHAVIQFRQVEVTKADGTLVRTVKPYVLDLESANGTFLNNNRIESRRYIELKEQDMLKFGNSTREYILMIEPPE